MILRRLIADLIAGEPRHRPQVTECSPLAEFFSDHTGRLISKWEHYFEIYHRHFERFRGSGPVVLEIGVFHGGSLQMWHHYFGPGTRMVGIDIDPRCRQFADDKTSILIGDQADRRFLAEVRRRVPHVDILIDDGGHRMHEQIATFEELYPHIQPNGVYLCEDMHTSVLDGWGAREEGIGTFLDYAKSLVDKLYGWYADNGIRKCSDPITRSTFGLHFYDSILVVEKRPTQPPRQCIAGAPSF